MATDTTTMTNDTTDTDTDEDSYDAPEWELRANLLANYGGVPRQRAKIVAMREAGYRYSTIEGVLDLASPGSIYNQLREFNTQHREATWLAENTDPFEDITDGDDGGDGET